MSRPQYLDDAERIQDILDQTPGKTMTDLVALTKRNYVAIQKATLHLREQGNVFARKQGKSLKFYPQ
jgi:predicted transcriptional regulator